MTQGIILYSDGGARPTNPGPAGWGLHGYLFSPDHPKKGTGNSAHVVTSHGYIEKVNFVSKKLDASETEQNWKSLLDPKAKTQAWEVTPIHYVDGHGSIDEHVSNNVAEMVAATEGLKHAAKFDVGYVAIYTDSDYVVKGITEWIHGWARNGWLKSNGEPPSNINYWKALAEAKDALTSRGVVVVFDWIRGHNDHLGNETADVGATIGVFKSQKKLLHHEITTAPAEGYWKSDADRHPFLANRRMYFNTLKEYNRPGEYYLGEHGSDDELLGKRISDGRYSLVRLAEPEPVLELVRNHTIDQGDDSDTIAMARLDEIFRTETYSQLMGFGEFAIVRPSRLRLDLQTIKKDPMVREIRPPLLAMRALDAIKFLEICLEDYLAGRDNLVVTDLTPILYETTIKTGKKDTSTQAMQLKAEYNVGFAALPVMAGYRKGDENATIPITLTLGIDMLDRNALKRLESRLPKVSLITWNESPDAFRYATVVQVGEDVGIWAGVYSNLRFINS